jgi:hypothetical protein
MTAPASAVLEPSLTIKMLRRSMAPLVALVPSPADETSLTDDSAQPARDRQAMAAAITASDVRFTMTPSNVVIEVVKE